MADLGVSPVEVRTPAQLAEVDALVMPGGESTTMRPLLVLRAVRGPGQALDRRLSGAWDLRRDDPAGDVDPRRTPGSTQFRRHRSDRAGETATAARSTVSRPTSR
ncbi:MAG: hypothetical protein R2705_18770 [Ilumatobacteraceae bacterium]